MSILPNPSEAAIQPDKSHRTPLARKFGDKLLTPSDVAKCLQMNERTVTTWLRKGRLRGYKIGKEWRVSRIDLEAFLEAGANTSADFATNSS